MIKMMSSSGESSENFPPPRTKRKPEKVKNNNERHLVPSLIDNSECADCWMMRPTRSKSSVTKERMKRKRRRTRARHRRRKNYCLQSVPHHTEELSSSCTSGRGNRKKFLWLNLLLLSLLSSILIDFTGEYDFVGL